MIPLRSRLRTNNPIQKTQPHFPLTTPTPKPSDPQDNSYVAKKSSIHEYIPRTVDNHHVVNDFLISGGGREIKLEGLEGAS